MEVNDNFIQEKYIYSDLILKYKSVENFIENRKQWIKNNPFPPNIK